MSRPDPQETWRKLQQTLANAQQQGRKFGGGGNPRNALGGLAGLLLLAGGAVAFNNALFN
ncbi:Prohibitin-2, subunit of the prohibitin complex (Phb1p-Phb2p), partial [Cryomyces antarcticus]